MASNGYLLQHIIYLQYVHFKELYGQKREINVNLKRGFRRITLTLSALIALNIAGICYFAFMDNWESERTAYNTSIIDYENITRWWNVWDADRWAGGKYEAIKTLLSDSPLFDFGDNKIVNLYWFQVFPCIPRGILNMPLDDLNREAHKAKEKAIKNARDRVESHQCWGTKSETEAILLGIITALLGAGLGYLGAYLAMWIGGIAIYKFVRWLILGFQDA
jgi:hypothetical protein